MSNSDPILNWVRDHLPMAGDVLQEVMATPEENDILKRLSRRRCRLQPYRARKSDGSTRALEPGCTTAVARKVSRDIDGDVRDRVRALAGTEAFEASPRERNKVEVGFAPMKGIHGLGPLRPRGLDGANDEVLLTAMAQTLGSPATLLRRPPLGTAAGCPA